MSVLDFTIDLAKILNLTLPVAADIIMLVRRKDGTVAIIPLLDETSEKFSEDIVRATEYLKEIAARNK